MTLNDESNTAGDVSHTESTAAEEIAAEDTAAEYTETNYNTHVDSHPGPDAENETTRSDKETLLDEIADLSKKDGVLSPCKEQLDLKLELPKHEKTSLMRMLTNFWAERSASGWQPLEYPLNVTDHVFADSDIIVREDEPSSLIAFTLGSEDYQVKLQKIQEKSGGLRGRHDRSHLQDPLLDTDEQMEVERSLLRSTGTHLKYQFQEGSAKMLCKIIIKNPSPGVEFDWFLLVMEILFYDRSPTRIFDFKGSMRSRRIQSTGEQKEVLLDENVVEFIYKSPLFAREHSKKLLRASVYNGTLFLSRQNVMDYSLMIAIDEGREELVVGIIDCIRTYTWDKKLESWIKDRGKNRPTVTSSRSRFREVVGRYVLQASE
ncbi:MAG: hypothetical protein Q9187_002904 [Circinaria calcarea]